MQTIIKAQVIDQTLRVTSLPKLASGGAEEIRVEVTFCSKWDNMGKTAVFYRNKGKVYEVVMVNDTCTIPFEVMTEPGKVFFGVVGVEGETVRTTEVVALTVQQGSIVSAVTVPLPDVYKQILTAYGAVNQRIVAEEANRAAEVAVERARIDNLAKLKDGSTTGDAELVDIRVGADGATYATAGEAVRDQLAVMNKRTTGMLLHRPETIALENMPIYSTDGFINESGEIVSHSGHQCVAFNMAGVKSVSFESKTTFTACAFIVKCGEEVYHAGKVVYGETSYSYTFPETLDSGYVGYFNWFGSKSGALDCFTEVTFNFDSAHNSKITTAKSWASIGDSITWLNDNGGTSGRPERGYQTRLQDRIEFSGFTNLGVNGVTMLGYNVDSIVKADIYTIALGINDWGATNLSPVGTLEDYKANADGSAKSNYAQCLRRMVNKIRELNPAAHIILMTPRRAYGFDNFLPDSSVSANGAGVYLYEFADLLIEVGRHEGFLVADLYYGSGMNDGNLADYSYDVALHPNDAGMQVIANVLYEPMAKLLHGGE